MARKANSAISAMSISVNASEQPSRSIFLFGRDSKLVSETEASLVDCNPASNHSERNQLREATGALRSISIANGDKIRIDGVKPQCSRPRFSNTWKNKVYNVQRFVIHYVEM